MRIIDADALLEEKLAVPIAPVLQGDFVHWRFMVPAEKIKDYPTVDAVPVVRCKDCRHWADNYVKTPSGKFVKNHYCSRGVTSAWSEWFCADGEREKDG